VAQIGKLTLAGRFVVVGELGRDQTTGETGLGKYYQIIKVLI